MAKEKEEKKPTKKPKLKLRSIHTHLADDGTVLHEHHYSDARGNPMPPTYGGTSSDLDDLQQHMADHIGPHMGGPNAGTAEPEGEEGQGEQQEPTEAE